MPFSLPEKSGGGGDVSLPSGNSVLAEVIIVVMFDIIRANIKYNAIDSRGNSAGGHCEQPIKVPLLDIYKILITNIVLRIYKADTKRKGRAK